MVIADPAADFWTGILSSYLRVESASLDQERQQLESLSSGAPDVWSYWDFLYFSVIVQTTVGFGDILPNSTAVRLLVAFQIFCGYLALVLVLNIVLAA